MHYIIGTRFSVKPDSRRGFISRENQFTTNISYVLTVITPAAGSLDYTFSGDDRTQVKLSFATGREADMFIAKIRGEQLPDYSAGIGKIDV